MDVAQNWAWHTHFLVLVYFYTDLKNGNNEARAQPYKLVAPRVAPYKNSNDEGNEALEGDFFSFFFCDF